MHHFYKFKYYFMWRQKTDYDFKWGPPKCSSPLASLCPEASPPSTVWRLGAGSSSMVGAEHGGMLSSIPNLHPWDATLTSCHNQKCLQILPHVLLGDIHAWLRTTGSQASWTNFTLSCLAEKKIFLVHQLFKPDLATVSSFAMSVSLFLFCRYIHLYHSF